MFIWKLIHIAYGVLTFMPYWAYRLLTFTSYWAYSSLILTSCSFDLFLSLEVTSTGVTKKLATIYIVCKRFNTYNLQPVEIHAEIHAMLPCFISSFRDGIYWGYKNLGNNIVYSKVNPTHLGYGLVGFTPRCFDLFLPSEVVSTVVGKYLATI